MSELKTKPTDEKVSAFLDAIEDAQKREDSIQIAAWMKEIIQVEPKMWGPSIVGFGDYHYKYASGQQGDWFLAGFSPRKQALTLYIMTGIDNHPDLLDKLGKFTRGKGCLYIKKLKDVDTEVLKELIGASVARLKEKS